VEAGPEQVYLKRRSAKRKRDSAQPQEREAQARQRAASRTRSASATARSLKKMTAGDLVIAGLSALIERRYS